jgi:ABC-type polar amino acid transport system ATPase subunit
LRRWRDISLATAGKYLPTLAIIYSCPLFGEVTQALDPQLVGEVIYTMRMLSKEGMTMIVVTH